MQVPGVTEEAVIVRIGDREVGDGRPALLVAELGINHNGSRETALEMVRAAAAAGADACKVQAFTAQSFCTERAMYKGESQLAMFKRYELQRDDFAAIADECRKQGVMFFGTPDSIEQARMLVDLGAPCIKVGSDDLVHLPLLRELDELDLPMIVSTGMATNDEITEAVEAIADCPMDEWEPDTYLTLAPEHVVLLHCVSRYPALEVEANLHRLRRMRKAYGLLVGFSDHTQGLFAAVDAVVAGACLVERHFTLSRSMPGPDHHFSCDPDQWRQMVAGIRYAEDMLGDGDAPDESEMRVIARRSVVAARALACGEIIEDGMLAYKRPGDGLPPVTRDRMVGKRMTRALVPDEQFREGDWA